MALFTIESPGISIKKLCQASTLKEIIEIGITKFNLPENADSYKVVLKSDNSEIEDDPVLLAYATQKQDTVALLIVHKDHQIEQENQMEVQPLPQNIPPVNNVPASNVGNQSNDVASSSSTKRAISLDDLMAKIGRRITEKCDNDVALEPEERKFVGKCISDYMVEDLQENKRSTANKIAKMLCQKYPNSFSVKIGTAVLPGHSSILQRVQNGVCYRTSRKRKQQAALCDSDDEHVKSKKKKSALKRKQDEYGCVAYEPVLPSDETTTTQEEKRKQITQLFDTGEVDDENQLNELIKLTYPTLRKNINSVPRNLATIFNEWPFLRNPQYLLDHASTLLGKNVEEEWGNSMKTKSKDIRRYFLSKAGGDKELKAIFNACKEVVKMEKNVTPKVLLTFPLLLNHFDEDEKYLYKIVDKDFDETSIDSIIEDDNPILVIKGDSLYDGKGKATFVLGGQILIRCQSTLQGILITFLAYYIFGYCYVPKIRKTLEFIQRILMDINPNKGHKTAKKSPYDVNPFVQNLSDALMKATTEYDLLDEFL